MQVANLGKSGVSVGYYDTEEAAAKAYDRAAIGLLGRDNCSITTNFPLTAYDEDLVSTRQFTPQLRKTLRAVELLFLFEHPSRHAEGHSKLQGHMLDRPGRC